MLRNTRHAVAAAGLTAATLAPVAGAFVLPDVHSTYRYAFDTDVLELEDNEFGQVGLYLVETLDAVTGPVALAEDDGLVTAGVAVVRDGQGLITIDLTGVADTDVDFPVQVASVAEGLATVHLSFAGPVSTGVLPAAVAGERWIKLAELTFFSGDVGGSALYHAVDADGGLDETVTAWDAVLDPDIAPAELLVHVTHTPEPATLALLALGAAALAPRRRPA